MSVPNTLPHTSPRQPPSPRHAPSEAERLRRHYRRWAREEQRRLFGYGHILRYELKAPLRAARTAYHGLALHAQGVARRHGIPRLRQFAQLWWANLAHGLEPESYYLFRLYLPDRWRRLGDWAQPTEVKPIYILLARHTSEGQAALLDDKRRFEAWCREAAVPTVRTLAVFEHGRVVGDARPPEPLPATDLFSKPVDGWGGHGAERWAYADARYVSSSGRSVTAPELLAHLAQESRRGALLLQPMLVNHPAVAPCSNRALCTARIVTVCDGTSDPTIELAVLRMPFGSQITDNFGAGGMIAPIDVATGRLGPAVRKDPETGSATCDHHPDTGVELAGRQLPDWTRATGMVLAAHGLLRRLPAVGWDVAFLPDGPIVLEANSNPGLGMAGTLGIPLGRSRWLRYVNDHAERILGPGGVATDAWF